VLIVITQQLVALLLLLYSGGKPSPLDLMLLLHHKMSY